MPGMERPQASCRTCRWAVGHVRYWGFHGHGGAPRAGWLISWNIPLNCLIWGYHHCRKLRYDELKPRIWIGALSDEEKLQAECSEVGQWGLCRHNTGGIWYLSGFRPCGVGSIIQFFFFFLSTSTLPCGNQTWQWNLSCVHLETMPILITRGQCLRLWLPEWQLSETLWSIFARDGYALVNPTVCELENDHVS